MRAHAHEGGSNGEGLCTNDAQCLSGHCVLHRCAAAAGVDNGQPCGQSSECRAGTCISGSCKGSAVLGDSCKTSADCAVGQCCGPGTATAKCASAC